MPASLDQQRENAALERLRERENPFANSVATPDGELRYNVPGLLEEQHRTIREIIDLFRRENRPSQIIPILGDPGAGKTHLLATLKRELDNDRQLFLISEGFPKDRDPADFFLWQIVNLLLGHRKSSVQLLNRLSGRVTARLLGETLRRLSPGGRLRLIPSSGFFDGLGRMLGFAAAVDEPLKKVNDLIGLCETEKFTDFAEAFPTLWDVGFNPDQIIQAIGAHLQQTEPSDADGFLRQKIYSGMVLATALHRPDELKEFLTGGFDEAPDYVAGTGDLTKRLLRVLLEIFATFHIPVVVAFDQLEDFLRAGNTDQEKELQLNFCRGLIALTNAVPNLCVLLFAERGLYNEVITGLDKFLVDRVHKPEINLPDRFNLEIITALIRARIQPTLGDLKEKEGLPAAFPFNEKDLKGVLSERSVRGCLQQLSKLYTNIVSGQGPAPAQIHQYLDTCWGHYYDRSLAEIDGISAAAIPDLTDTFKFYLDFWAEQHLTEQIPWSKNEVIHLGHKLFGHLNLLRPGPRSAGLGIGFWLAELRGRPADLAAKLAFFDIKPAVIRRLVVLRRDGTTALAGKAGEVFNKAESEKRDVSVEELTDDDLAIILRFPEWLKAADAFISQLPELQREVGKEARNDIARERTRGFMEKIQKWLGGQEEAGA